ncbi:MAG: S9 family peptidase [Elusimicrobia bacterium]|nr:S9 family peptidase [Elusimicrobiota bacterium]
MGCPQGFAQAWRGNARTVDGGTAAGRLHGESRGAFSPLNSEGSRAINFTPVSWIEPQFRSTQLSPSIPRTSSPRLQARSGGTFRAAQRNFSGLPGQSVHRDITNSAGALNGFFDGSRPPPTRKGNHVDDYFGVKVPDPYRWLENPHSPETKGWVKAQNKFAARFLKGSSQQTRRLVQLARRDSYGLPQKQGRYYIFPMRQGDQEYPVIYKMASLRGKRQVLLDPGEFSEDGTASVYTYSFSEDGRYMAYALSYNGSDWKEWRVRDVETGRDLSDRLQWSKFFPAAWNKSGSGFYYFRYPEPKPGEEYTGKNLNERLYFHALGTDQSQDTPVSQVEPGWDLQKVYLTEEDDSLVLIYQSQDGSIPASHVHLLSLKSPSFRTELLSEEDDFDYFNVVGNDGDILYVHTDRGAPRGRLVAINRRHPEPERWKELIPQAPEVLSHVSMVHDRFVATWMKDASHQMKIYNLEGTLEREITLPDLGTVFLEGDRKDRELFYIFSSFLQPPTVYRYDFSSGKSSVVKRPRLQFEPRDYEVKDIFYPSKDGTRVHMFLVYKKGLKLNGKNPVHLYGYGGFNIAITPWFGSLQAAWIEKGGIWAVASLRGGAEYGRDWHHAGRRDKKQNVFDDFIAAAEWLIQEKYTSPARLSIGGGSNGGLLVGAALNQRPDLFGAAKPTVGVMDMFRFHEFTVGRSWISEYGSSQTKEGFDVLMKYSPLHKVRPGTSYPATLVLTADHDDRVVPAHSHKFTATLQAAQAGKAPILTRVTSNAGHGGGSFNKALEELKQTWIFLIKALGLRWNS